MNQSLGILLVKLVLDDKRFTSGAARATKAFAELAGGLQSAASLANQAIASSFEVGEKALEEFSKATVVAGGRFAENSQQVQAAVATSLQQFGTLQQQADNLNERNRQAAREREAALQRLADAAERANQQVVRSFKLGTAALLGFTTAAGVIGAGFQRQVDVIGAISGATEEQLAALEDRTRELGATTRFTATQAAEGLTALAQAGASVGEAIAVSGDALNTATANRVGLEEATQSLIATTRQFASQNVDSARAADVLTRATQVSLLNFQELTTALRFGGVTAASFGISLEETATGLAAFRDLGLEASQAGTVLRGALAGAAIETDQNRETLRQIGLTFQDINPEVNGFIGLVENLAASAAETDDILSIFGVRAGPGLANLVQNIRSGAVDLRALNATISDSAGTTQRTVEAVSDNVSTQLAILRSAIEDVFLETFGAIDEPLQAALETLQEFFGQIAVSISEVSGTIEGNLTRAASRLGSTVADSGSAIADTFANVLVLASQFVAAVAPLVELFSGLVPLVDDLAFAIGTAFLAGRAAAFVRVLVGLPALISAATAAMTAFGTATTVSTGGLSALAAAVAVVVTGFGVYINTLGKAQAATESLAAAQDAAAATSQAQADAIAQRLEPLLRRQQERARLLLETSSNLSDAREAELQEVLRLTAAEAAAAVATGRLVEANGELRTTQSLVEEGGRDQAESLKLIAEASAETARELQPAIDRVSSIIEAFDNGRISGSLAAAQLRDFAGAAENVLPADVVTGARQRLILLTQEQQAAATRARNISQSVTDALRVQVVALAEGADEATAVVQGASDEQVKALADALGEIERLRAAALGAGAGLFLSEPQQIRRDLDIQLAALDAAFAEVAARTAANDEERIAAEAAVLDARVQLQANANEELRQIAQQAADDQAEIAEGRADTVRGIVEGEVDRIEQIRRDGEAALAAIDAAGVEQRLAIQDEFAAGFAGTLDPRELAALARERNAALTALDQQLSDDRLAIEKSTADRLAEEREKQRDAELQRTRDFIDQILAEPGPLERVFDEAVRSILAGLEQLAPGLARGVTDSVKVIEGAVEGISALFGPVLKIFDALTGGFDVDVEGTIGALADAELAAAEAVKEAEEALAVAQAGGDPTAIAEAAEVLAQAQQEALAAGSQDAAAIFVQDLVDGAIQFVRSLADNIGPIIQAFTDAVPDLIQAVVDQIPAVTQAIADSLPGLIDTLGDAIVDIVDAVVASVGPIITAIVEAIPDLLAAIGEAVVALVGSVGEIIDIILDNLDVIILALFDAVSEIVASLGEVISVILTSIAENLDDILISIIDGVLQLLVTLASEIPEIIKAVIDAIPDIVLAILDAIPTIISSVIGAIPDIIQALLDAIPGIITSILEAIPAIIVGLLEAIPEIITSLIVSLVEAIPEILFALLEAIPTIIAALITGLVEALPQIITALVELLPNLLSELIPALLDALFGPEGLISRLPEMVFLIGKAIVEAIADVFQSIVESISEALAQAFGPIADLFGISGGEGAEVAEATRAQVEATQQAALAEESFAEEIARLQQAAQDLAQQAAENASGGGFLGLGNLFGGGAQGGVPFVQRTTGMLVHAGEAILTAQENRERLFGPQGTGPLPGRQNPIAPAGAANFPAGGGGGPTTIVIDIGGKEWDRFEVEADAAGNRGLSNRLLRRKTDTRVAFRRPSQLG